MISRLALGACGYQNRSSLFFSYLPFAFPLHANTEIWCEVVVRTTPIAMQSMILMKKKHTKEKKW